MWGIAMPALNLIDFYLNLLIHDDSLKWSLQQSLHCDSSKLSIQCDSWSDRLSDRSVVIL